MLQCLACGQSFSKELFNPGPQPLAALNLPKTEEEALNAVRHPMNFHSCLMCGHIWNTEFEYARVPYSGDSNLMYNRGSLWNDHIKFLIESCKNNKACWIDDPIIDIGCGDGLFFSKLLEEIPDAQCIGFEPGIESNKISHFTCIKDYFVPERDLKKYRPSLLVCRHVLEHLENPRQFLSEISYWCSQYELTPTFLAEVPCFDVALETGRISDFLYEHVSNFTLNSFNTLFTSSGFQMLELGRLYDDEVLVGYFQPHNLALKYYEKSTEKFRQTIKETLLNVQKTTANLSSAIYSVNVFWGGTGKSAAFLNFFKLDHENYPLVVDSDENKVGKYVPGTGQLIRSPSSLQGVDIDTIVITTPWRARDIFIEIQKRQLNYRHLLVLQNGELNEYTGL